MVTFPVTLTDP